MRTSVVLLRRGFSARSTAQAFGLAGDGLLEVRETKVSQRGIYLAKEASPVQSGTALLMGEVPLVEGNSYDELIASLLIKTTREQIQQGAPRPVTNAILQLAFPSNLLTKSFSKEEARVVTTNMDLVKRRINTTPDVGFEIVDELDRNVYLRLWGVLALNSIRILGKLRLYGALSLLNHSCYPTCSLHDNDKGETSLVVRVGETLQPDQQLTINYIESQSQSERWSASKSAEHLHQNYGIVCTGSPRTCTCMLY